MKGTISNRQKAVLDELFAGEQNQLDILDKYKVTKFDFEKWLSQKSFSSALQSRIKVEYLNSAVLLARYAPVAAARLITLTDSEKPETARRACLDIIQLGINNEKKEPDESDQQIEQKQALPDETARRILEVLAEGNNLENKITIR
jgi:hypothetical protein